MKKGLIKNKKLKRAVCALLCVLFCFQSVSFAVSATAGVPQTRGANKDTYKYSFDEKYKDYYLIANIEDEWAEAIGKIDPAIDELLDLYVELSLYDLTREQAITSMLKKFLIDNYDALPYMGDALLTAYDRFGGYYPQVSTQQIFSNAYRGYGIALSGKKILDGYKYGAIIEQVFYDTPASRAGLKTGDEIIRIEEINVEGFGMRAVSNLLETYENKVGITVKRGGKEIPVSMLKETVYIPSVSFYPDDGSKTAIIKIADFTDDYMLYDLFDAYEYLKENKYKNIIFDLRGNHGGDLMYMVESLNMFVPEEGTALCTLMDKDGNTETAYSSGDGLKLDKICILVNGESASASEIFSLSLREITGAVIIGETTYGKGVGQYYVSLENGDTAAITSFEILSSNGNSYHKKGVEPDIKLSPKYKEADKDKEDKEDKTFGQLNFVNCRDIKKGADNSAVLALNQRLAEIGYISPEDVSSKCTEQTITAVEIFQRYNNLHIGLSKIDYIFLDYLNYYTSNKPGRYEERDIQLECAGVYISKNTAAAKDYAEGFDEE